MALGITACIVAWGYLVVAAVDFGSTARGGDTQAWWFLALASLGAVACLFVGFMLVARVLRRLGITRAPDEAPSRGHEGAHANHHEGSHAAHHEAGHSEPGDTVRPVGGRRAAR